MTTRGNAPSPFPSPYPGMIGQPTPSAAALRAAWDQVIGAYATWIDVCRTRRQAGAELMTLVALRQDIESLLAEFTPAKVDRAIGAAPEMLADVNALADNSGSSWRGETCDGFGEGVSRRARAVGRDVDSTKAWFARHRAAANTAKANIDQRMRTLRATLDECARRDARVRRRLAVPATSLVAARDVPFHGLGPLGGFQFRGPAPQVCRPDGVPAAPPHPSPDQFLDGGAGYLGYLWSARENELRRA